MIPPLAPRFRLPAVAAAASLFVASCGGAEEPAASGSGGPSSSADTTAGDQSQTETASESETENTADTGAESGLLPPAEGTTSYPLTLTTALGEITIPERPERVVMADSWDIDYFAALGVVPVGTDEQVTFYPWSLELFASEIETVWPVGDELYPAEQIAGTDPDLIITTNDEEPDNISKISAVAPVLGPPADGGAAAPWQERILLIGQALDLSDRAQQVIDDYDATFEQIRQDHPEFEGLTVDYVVFWGGDAGTAFINTSGSDSEALLSSLGFAPNPQASNSALEEALSDELLGTLEGDILLISNQAPEEFDDWFDNQLLQGLDSVQQGRVVVLDLSTEDFTVSHEGEPTDFVGHLGRAFTVGPLAHIAVAELLVPLLADVLE